MLSFFPKNFGFPRFAASAAACLLFLLPVKDATSSYLPVTGSNIGIGTSTPVGALTVMSGNVGIGTWSPIARLQVVGTLRATTFVGDGSGLTGLAAGATITDLDNTTKVQTEESPNEEYIRMDTSGVERMVIQPGGNVGISTANPANLFAVGTTSQFQVDATGAIASVTGITTSGGYTQSGTGTNILTGNVGMGTATPVGALAVLSGNVGIGTWSPTQRLEVVGTVSATAFVGDGSGLTNLPGGASGWTDGGTNVYTSTTTDNVGIGTTTPTAALFIENAGTKDSLRINDDVPDSFPFVIDDSGLVGIGTTDPVVDLHINSIAPKLKFTSGFTGYLAGDGFDILSAVLNVYLINYENGFIGLATNGTERFRVDSAGNIGMGTTTPVGGTSIMNGNVGIGTWSPIGQLEVRGGSGATRIWTGAGTDTNATAGGELYVEGDLEVDGTIYGDGSGITALPSGLPAGGWTDGGTNVYTSTTTDNVGIGTTTPVGTLTVKGGVGIGTITPYTTIAPPANGLIVDGNVGIGTWQANNGKLIIMGGNVGVGTVIAGARLAVMDGNVGIGTWAPQGRLVVMGGNVGIGYDGTQNELLTLGPESGGSTARKAIRFRMGGYASPASPNTNSDGDKIILYNNSNLEKAVVGVGGTTANTMWFQNHLSGFEFWTGASGGAASPTLKVAIINSGNVGIGTSNPVGALAVMNGNVGIGTWSPTQRLQVIGTVNATAFVGDGSGLTNVANTSGWTDGGTNVYTSTTTDNVGIGTTTPTATLLVENASTLDSLRVNDDVLDSTPFIITNAGNVGIGTTKPVAELHLSGGFVGPTLQFTNTIVGNTASDGFGMAISGSDFIMAHQENGAIRLSTNSIERMRIEATGNVGIGTTSVLGGALVVLNGNVGIGTWTPGGSLEVKGGMGSRIWTGGGTNTNATAGGELYVERDLEVDGTIYGDGSGITALPSGLPAGGWTDGGTNVYTSTTTDNVGIGTTTPTAALLIENAGTQDSFRVNDAVLDGTPFVIDPAGNAGIGTTTPASKIDISNTSTITSGNYYLSNNTLRVSPGSASTADLINLRVATQLDTGFATSSVKGIYNETYLSAGASPSNVYMNHNKFFMSNTGTVRTIAQLIGSYNEFNPSDSGLTTTALYGVYNYFSPTLGTITDLNGIRNYLMNMTTVTSAYGVHNNITNLATMGSAYGVYSTIVNASTLTNAYGLYIDTVQGSNKWSVYARDPSAPSYFAGNTGIGTYNPVNKLVVNGGVGIGTALSSSFINTTAPSGGLIVENNVGIGTSTPVGALTVMNGNVGIGTWSPRAALEVVGSVLATSFVGDGSGLTNLPGGASGWTDGGTNVYTSTTTDNVGIGTTTPNAATLEIVKNAAQPLLKMSSTATGSGDFLIVGSSGNVGIGTTETSTTAFSVLSGNVGIGTWKPNTTLHVKGKVTAQDEVIINASLSGGFYLFSSAADNPYLNMGLSTDPFGQYYGRFEMGSDLGYRNIVLQPFGGNVGIGTYFPTVATLSVNGESYFAGQVGIGTFTPTGMLDVRQDEARIWTGGGTSTFAVSAGELYVEGDLEVDGTIYGDGSGITALPSGLPAGGWTDGGTNVYTSTTTDNVGIGTTTPTAALLIENAGAQDSFRINDAVLDGSPFIIDAGGNTGIGTTDPLTRLHISGPYESGYGQLYIDSTSGHGWININGPSASETGIGIMSDGSYKWQLYRPSGTNDFRFYEFNGSQDRFSLSAGGNVGIGTITPVGALTVMNGNVGIGTWSPRAKLEVVGSVLATSFYGDGSNLTNLPSGGGWTDGGTNVYTTTTTDMVGIGTTTPNTASLEIVKSSSRPPLKISSTASGNGDYLLMTSSGTIGIGSNSPRMQLDVLGAGNAGGDLGFMFQNTTPGGYANNRFVNNSGIDAWVGIGGTSTNAAYNSRAYISSGGTSSGISFIAETGANPDMRFYFNGNTASEERIRFDTNANVGIGTSTPLSGLAVMNGNVGIGTWNASSRLLIRGGNIGIGTTTQYLRIAAPTNGMAVEGNVGIGTWAANNGKLIVMGGNVGIGTTVPRGSLIVSGGNIGFGTTSPVAQFEIVANQNDDASVRIRNTSVTGISGLELFDDSSVFAGIIGHGNSSHAYTNLLAMIANTADIAFITGDTYSMPGVTRMIITNSGNVGIGTTTPVGGTAIMNGNAGIGTWSPRAKLEVIGSVLATSFYGDGSNLTGISAGGGWTDGGTNVYTSTTTDLVAIGTTTPVSKLTLAGNMSLGTTLPYRAISSPTDGMIVEGNVGIGTWITTNAKVNIVSTSEQLALTEPTFSRPTLLYTTSNGQFNIKPTQNSTVAMNLIGGSATTYLSFTESALGDAVITGATSGRNFILQANSGGGIVNVVSNLGIGTTTPVGGLSVMNGNVGIGTWSPIGKLEVKGGPVIVDSGGGTNTNATGSGELYVQGDLEVDGTIYGDGSGLTGASSLTAAGGWTDGGTNVYTTTTTDNVGIGTTTPTAALLLQNAGSQDTLRVNDAVADGSPFIIDAGGNVGIGTTVPGDAGGSKPHKLAIVGDATVGTWHDDVGQLQIRGASNSAYQLTFGINTGATTPYGWITSSEQSGPHRALALQPDNGNVGIGTTAPLGRLTVIGGNVGIGTTDPSSRLTIPLGNIGIGSTLPYRRIAAPTNGMAIEGNVGIGTWNPTANLDVFGHIKIRTPSAGNDALYILYPGTGTGVVSYRPDQGFSVTGTTDFSPVLFSLNRNNTSSDFFALTHTTSGDRFMVKNSGNVGIGTADPIAGLAVMNGNVGIGTWSPVGALEVKASGSAQVTINGASGGCLMFRDTDNAGWTECNALNGVLTCSVDADGLCDGS